MWENVEELRTQNSNNKLKYYYECYCIVDLWNCIHCSSGNINFPGIFSFFKGHHFSNYDNIIFNISVF